MTIIRGIILDLECHKLFATVSPPLAPLLWLLCRTLSLLFHAPSPWQSKGDLGLESLDFIRAGVNGLDFLPRQIFLRFDVGLLVNRMKGKSEVTSSLIG
jgi:hypothetical protein